MRIGDVDRLVADVQADPDVVGVVLLGSAAATARAEAEGAAAVRRRRGWCDTPTR